MDLEPIQPLLEDLKNPDEAIRSRATQQLWHIWFKEKGMTGIEAIQKSETWLRNGNAEKAEEVLTKLIRDYPNFAEAWNRRAVLYYTIGEYQKAIEDCQMAIAINPVHFGALHGLGLCYACLGEYREAIRAFRRALEIQPYAIENQRLILECTARLEVG